MTASLYEKYPYIYGWGRMMGSQGWYIQDQLELAEEDNAPLDATYKQRDGTWSILSNCIYENTRDQVISWGKEVK